MDAPPDTPAAAIPKEEPKKFIRTFEGDAAALEHGTTPGLVPFVKGHAEEPLIVADMPEPTPPPVPPPAPEESIPLPPLPEIVKDEPAATITPPVVPRPVHTAPTIEKPIEVAPKITPPPPPPPVEKGSAPLQTYAGDFADRLMSEHASPATVLAAEEDAGPNPGAGPSPLQHKRVWPFVVLGIVLLVFGGAGSYIAYVRYEKNTLPVAVIPVASAPIFVDDRVEITGTSTPLLAQINTSVNAPLTPGTVRLLFETGTTSEASVFNNLSLPAPDILLRNITPQNSMAGIINSGGTQTPFFILSVTSYGDTFAGMLSWEKTMPNDLSALFPPHESSPVASSTVATTTVVLKTSPQFADEVIANHDARVYSDAGGEVVVYGYWNQSTLVLARDTAAFTEIISRLATSKSTQQ